MAWKLIAEASTEQELETLTPLISDIPNGSQMYIDITLPSWLPFGNLADMAGAEWLARQFMGYIDITDVSSPSIHTIRIEGYAIGLFWFIVVPVLITVLAGLSAFGIYAWQNVKVHYYQSEIAKTQKDTEAARIAFIDKYLPIYGDVVFDWLEGITKPPPEVIKDNPSILDELKKALPSFGIGAGVAIAIALALLFFMGRR